MECAQTKPLKQPSSNITDMVSKFGKVCRLRSIGVFSGENPHTQNHPAVIHKVPLIGESSSTSTDASATTEEIGKVRCHPVVVPPGKSGKMSGGDKDIIKLFDSVSALKLAYIQLQEAHVPYNPDKILAADEVVMSQLQTLCNIRRSVKEKRLEKTKLQSFRLDSLRAEVEAKERVLELLKSESGAKEAEIARLREELHDLATGNLLLGETIKSKNLERKSWKVVDTTMFEEIFRSAYKSIHDFAKPMISLMKASGWDLDLAANVVVNGATYSKRSHKKYAFEAYISWRMFHGMALESYDVDDVLRCEDPIKLLIENPSSGFANFCAEKYMLVVHPVMEVSFFRNLDHRMLVISGKHPRTPLYQIFVRMAKWIWILQGVATSIDPQAKVFAVNRGSEFSDVYMESVKEEKAEGAGVSDNKQFNNIVEFMIMPGFRIQDRLVKSLVYLSKPK
ncbi:Protein GRAVITROPIC IN THE LIGHT 1 [Linum grandiflorum]